jgi:hypothetical protein
LDERPHDLIERCLEWLRIDLDPRAAFRDELALPKRDRLIWPSTRQMARDYSGVSSSRVECGTDVVHIARASCGKQSEVQDG